MQKWPILSQLFLQQVLGIDSCSKCCSPRTIPQVLMPQQQKPRTIPQVLLPQQQKPRTIPQVLIPTTAGAGLGNTTQAQGSSPQFSANLTGDLTFPPTVTNATGTGEFTVVRDGNTMQYTIDTNNLDKVTDVFVAASRGKQYTDFVKLRSGVNEGISSPINRTLVEGNFTSSHFTGRLNIDQM